MCCALASHVPHAGRHAGHLTSCVCSCVCLYLQAQGTCNLPCGAAVRIPGVVRTGEVKVVYAVRQSGGRTCLNKFLPAMCQMARQMLSLFTTTLMNKGRWYWSHLRLAALMSIHEALLLTLGMSCVYQFLCQCVYVPDEDALGASSQ